MKEDEIQSNMIKINNDILSTVKICYYENMNDEWKLICENNNLPYDKLKIKNPMSIWENHHISKMNMLKIKNINMLTLSHYNGYLSPKHKQLIYNFYKEDFINFGYDSDLSNMDIVNNIHVKNLTKF